MTIPASVSLGLSGLQGISPGTSGVSNTISFGAAGYYEFAFGTSDNGSTITIFDLNRALTNFDVASINTLNVTATGTITGNIVNSLSSMSAVGNITAGNVLTSGVLSTSANVVGGNLVTSGVVSSSGSVIAASINAPLTPPAGTSSTAPVTLAAGSLLTTPVAGTMEKDASVFYATPTEGSSGAQRAVISTPHFITVPTGGRTLTQNTSAQSVFNNPTNGSIQLDATTTYEIEGLYVITNTAAPSVDHYINVLFGIGGSLVSINYLADVTTSSGSPSAGATTVSRSHSTVTTAVQITPSNTTTSNETVTVHLRGIVRTNAAGTFTPQIQYGNNAPTGTSVVTADSWFRIAPLGTSGVVSVGNWS